MPIRSNAYHIPDCVIRAISTATGYDYFVIMKLLHINGKMLKCDDLSVTCYEYLLDNDLRFPHYRGYGKKVKDISREYKDNILLIRTEGHLTVSMQGVILDTFDCSNSMVTDYWIVE